MNLFPWLLLLHVLGAIVAFGPSFTFPIIGSMGGKEPQHANFATRVSFTIGNRLVAPLAIFQGITGVLLIMSTNRNLLNRSEWWLDIAIVLYLLAMAFSILIQSRNVARVIEMTSAPPPPGASGPPPELASLIRRVRLGGMFTMILLVAIVSLMVLKPQF